MLEVLVIFGLLFTFCVLPVWAVQDLIRTRREKRTGSVSGGIAGMMTEIDRVVRPSVQHVIEAEDPVEKEEDDIGGD